MPRRAPQGSRDGPPDARMSALGRDQLDRHGSSPGSRASVGGASPSDIVAGPVRLRRPRARGGAVSRLGRGCRPDGLAASAPRPPGTPSLTVQLPFCLRGKSSAHLAGGARRRRAAFEAQLRRIATLCRGPPRPGSGEAQDQADPGQLPPIRALRLRGVAARARSVSATSSTGGSRTGRSTRPWRRCTASCGRGPPPCACAIRRRSGPPSANVEPRARFTFLRSSSSTISGNVCTSRRSGAEFS